MTAIASWQVVDKSGTETSSDGQAWHRIWHDGQGLCVSRNTDRKSDRYRLQFYGHAEFEVIPDKKLIISPIAGQNAPQSTLDHIIADQIEPRVLAHEGKLVVHASAIEVAGLSVLFVGDSGAGKSTLAASFNRTGVPMLGDDAMIIEMSDTNATARALYPSLRLLPDSLSALYPSSHPSTAVSHYGSKRRLNVSIHQGGRCEALQIAAIFALRPEGIRGPIGITPMSPADACMIIVSNSFALNPTDLHLAARKLSKASAIANRIPSFELAYPRDYQQLPAVQHALLKSLKIGNRGD